MDYFWMAFIIIGLIGGVTSVILDDRNPFQSAIFLMILMGIAKVMIKLAIK